MSDKLYEEFDDVEEIDEAPLERPRFVYTTQETEPAKAPELEVELGGEVYLANCPNDYDFILIWRQLDDIRSHPTSVNIREIISGFFNEAAFKQIDARCRGGRDAPIKFDELTSALAWLVEQYGPYVNDRSKEANRATRRAKKAPVRHKGGR